jgi:hypothetical protein
MTVHQPWRRNFVNAAGCGEPTGEKWNQVTEQSIKKVENLSASTERSAVCLVLGDV